jgi:predicted DNA-binding transcriptional regulator YafY
MTLDGGGRMRIDRLFGIVYLLLDKKNMTAGELAGHFEVSVRTILRDIDTLSAAGIPVYTSQGKGGGVALIDRYVLNKAAVSDEEQNQILFALQSLSATGSLDTSTVLSKLRAIFDKTKTDWIEVDFSRWGHHERDKIRFGLLKRALTENQTIRFAYANARGETTNRSVCPLKLVYKSRSWYLQGYCLLKRDYRTFKINRMLSVELLPESFDWNAFDPPRIDEDATPPDALIRVKMNFSPHAAYRIYDEFDADDISVDSGGSFLVEVNLEEDDWLYEFLLSFGASVRVLEPQSVKDRLLAKAEEIKNAYSDGIT